MFYIDPAKPEGGCPCCGGTHPSHGFNLDLMAIDCLALTVARTGFDAGAQESIQRARVLANRDDVEFQEMELAAALALAQDAISLIPEMEAIIGSSLREAMRSDEVYAAIERANAEWRRQSFKKGTAAKFEDAMTLSLATGIATVDDAVFVDAQFRKSILEGMTKSAKYYTNEFFNTQVMPSLINSVENALAGNAPAGVAGFKHVQAVLNARLKSVPYWSTVANAAASRSFHYGMLRAGSLRGNRTFRFVAVMDERTSAICTSMNNTEWPVDRGLDIMNRVANAEHPEDVKQITPWIKDEDLQRMSRADMMDAGVIVPPLHGRCRSTIQIF